MAIQFTAVLRTTTIIQLQTVITADLLPGTKSARDIYTKIYKLLDYNNS